MIYLLVLWPRRRRSRALFAQAINRFVRRIACDTARSRTDASKTFREIDEQHRQIGSGRRARRTAHLEPVEPDELARSGLCAPQERDRGDRYLRSCSGAALGRASAHRRARGQPNADPRGPVATRARRLHPHRASARHLYRAQIQARDHRNDPDVGGARIDGGAPRDAPRPAGGDREATAFVRRVSEARPPPSICANTRTRTSPFTPRSSRSADRRPWSTRRGIF